LESGRVKLNTEFWSWGTFSPPVIGGVWRVCVWQRSIRALHLLYSRSSATALGRQAERNSGAARKLRHAQLPETSLHGEPCPSLTAVRAPRRAAGRGPGAVANLGARSMEKRLAAHELRDKTQLPPLPLRKSCRVQKINCNGDGFRGGGREEVDGRQRPTVQIEFGNFRGEQHRNRLLQFMVKIVLT